jgi:hypothetical protein
MSKRVAETETESKEPSSEARGNGWVGKIAFRVSIIVLLLLLGFPVKGCTVGFVEFGLPGEAPNTLPSQRGYGGYQGPSWYPEGMPCYNYIGEEVDCSTVR